MNCLYWVLTLTWTQQLSSYNFPFCHSFASFGRQHKVQLQFKCEHCVHSCVDLIPVHNILCMQLILILNALREIRQAAMTQNDNSFRINSIHHIEQTYFIRIRFRAHLLSTDSLFFWVCNSKSCILHTTPDQLIDTSRNWSIEHKNTY